MTIGQRLRVRIQEVAAELREEIHGPRGCPPWGTKFVDMEQETGEVGDAVACEMRSRELQTQVEAAGNEAGIDQAPVMQIGFALEGRWSSCRVVDARVATHPRPLARVLAKS